MTGSRDDEAPKHMGIEKEFQQALRAAEQYNASTDHSEHQLVEIMRHVLAMYMHAQKDKRGMAYLNALYSQAGIKAAHATPNPFTRLLKLTAPKMAKEVARRSAAVLDFARRRRISPDNLIQFIDTEGGSVECAKAARRAMAEDSRRAKLRQFAMPLSVELLRKNIEDGLCCCLIDIDGRRVDLLSFMYVGSTKKFKPLKEEEFLDFFADLLKAKFR